MDGESPGGDRGGMLGVDSGDMILEEVGRAGKSIPRRWQMTLHGDKICDGDETL